MSSLEGLPAVLTVKEAAAVLKLGRDQTYACIASGQIPSLRFGRRIVVPRAALEKLLAGEPVPAPVTGPGVATLTPKKRTSN